MDPMLVLLIVIVFAYASGEMARHFGIPRVVGQLFAGLILGLPIVKPYLLTAGNGELLQFLADLGILLLFFFVGLQIDMKAFRTNIGESSLVAVFNTLLPFVGGFAVMYYLLDFGFIASITIGMCLSVSSQSVSLAVLDELRMLKSRISQHIITAGAVDDLFEVALVSVVLTLINASSKHASTTRVFMDVGIFVAAIIAFRYLIVPIIMNLFAKEKSITHLFTGAIVVTLILALVTLYLGLGAIIGALFAGIIVREILLSGRHKKPWEEHNIAKAIHIVSFGFLVPVFFVWVGINTDITSVISDWHLILVFIAIAIAGTVLGSVLGVISHGGTAEEGFIVGAGLSAKGDIELVIATLALANTIITEDIFSALIMMAFFTTLFSPVFFRYLMRRYKARIA